MGRNKRWEGDGKAMGRYFCSVEKAATGITPLMAIVTMLDVSQLPSSISETARTVAEN